MNVNYWSKYRDFWDHFVKEWFEKRPDEPADQYSQAIKRCVGDEFDELPEPYYGTPDEGVKAVIVNLNPGMSQTDDDARKENLERQKFYSLRDTYSGEGLVSESLIREFSDACGKRYSKFAEKWSCLNPKFRGTNLCGVKWWQGTAPSKVGGRLEWLARIYDKKLDAAKSIDSTRKRDGELNPLEVFALELCPYHSKSFSFDANTDVLPFVVEHVLQPAFHAVVENRSIPFAVAIGKPFAVLLEKIGDDGKFGLSAKLEKEWWNDSEDVEKWHWPKVKDKGTCEYRQAYRKYCLFALKEKNGMLARFLVCAAPGSNNPPGKDFETIEKKQILPYVRDTPLTDELYGKLQPLPLHWWPRNSKKKRAG